MTGDLGPALNGVPKEQYSGDHGAHILDQYRMYVEMAVRISDRRQNANIVFMSINAVFVAVLGTLSSKLEGYGGLAWYVISCCAAMVLSCSWCIILTALRRLNMTKFEVVLEIENRLPIRPYQAEKTVTGWGTGLNPYGTMARVENIVPWVFFGLYFVLMMIAVATKAYSVMPGPDLK